MKDLKLTELLGLGSISAFIDTILYIYGYSKASGVNLFSYFSINDYFRLAIEWLTPILIGVLVGVLISAVSSRIERGKTEEEIIAGSPNPKFTRAFRKSGEWAPSVTIVVVAVLYTILSYFKDVPRATTYVLWGASSFIIWINAVLWYMQEPKLVASWNKTWAFFVMFAPAFAFVAYFYGQVDAEVGFRVVGKGNEVRVVLDSRKEVFPGRILFVLDEYVLMRGGYSYQFTILPKREIKMIVHDE